MYSTVHRMKGRGGVIYCRKNRLMGNVAPRTWTPSITPRTTASLTCWTSATWRAGEGQRAVKHYYLRFTSPRLRQFLPFYQGFGGDCGVDGVQHLVHQAVLQRPAHSKYKPLRFCFAASAGETFTCFASSFRGQRSPSRSCTQSANPPAWRRSPWRTQG